jgi:hypothetical protein
LQHRTGFKGITRPERPNNCDYGVQKAPVNVISATKTSQKVVKITKSICGVRTAWGLCHGNPATARAGNGGRRMAARETTRRWQ